MSYPPSFKSIATTATAAIVALMAAPALADQAAPASKDAGSAHGQHVASPGAQPMIHADVIGTDGKALGMVMLQETTSGVLVSTDITGLPAGDHGFHFHEKGVCDSAAKFASAGGHFTGSDHMHGLMVKGGPHGGDMPNQHVGADGVLKSQVLNTGVTLGPGPKSLLDVDGSALVIHAKPDDYTSQPSGNAGDRIACAVVAAPK